MMVPWINVSVDGHYHGNRLTGTVAGNSTLPRCGGSLDICPETRVQGQVKIQRWKEMNVKNGMG